MSCFYFSTLFPSNAIIGSTIAKIFCSSDLANCLIIAKANQLEIHEFFKNESFRIPITFRILAMTTIKTNEENDDFIFFARDDNFCEICKIDKNRNLISYKRLSHLGDLKQGKYFYMFSSFF